MRSEGTGSVEPRRGWQDSLGAFANPQVLRMLFLGFASGLPFPLVLTTLSLRLREAGIDRTTIGFFSLVGLSYSLKFFWSPIVDRVRLPLLGGLGRRRSWMLFAQCGLVAGLIAMALNDPARHAEATAWLAVFTAFCSATQDIAIDAFRIDSTAAGEQGPVVSAYQTGYQLALICGGAGALFAAAGSGWTTSYLAMAACMLTGPLTTMIVAEPLVGRTRAAAVDQTTVRSTIAQMQPAKLFFAMLVTLLIGIVLALSLYAAKQPTTVVVVTFSAITAVQLALLILLRVRALRPQLEHLTGAVVLPLVDVLRRYGMSLAVPMLLLILTYRLNYSTMGAAANTFYFDLGYTKSDIAWVSKLYGILMTITGSLLAGVLVKRSGTLPTMLIGLLLLSAANLFYAYMGDALSPNLAQHLAHAAGAQPPPRSWLAAAVSIDNLANGIAGTAFIVYMSSLTSTAYTATQYALFGTLWSLPAKSIASQWGRIVDAFGYPPFFVYTAIIGAPSLLLILWLMHRPIANPQPIG